EVEIAYKRGEDRKTTSVTLRAPGESGGYLGVAPGQREFIKAGWSAPVTGVVTTAQFSWLTLTGVKDLAVNTAVGVKDKVVNGVNTLIFRKSPDEKRQKEADQKLSEASKSVAGPI